MSTRQSAIVTFRMSPEEKMQLTACAAAQKIPLNTYLHKMAFGPKPMIDSTVVFTDLTDEEKTSLYRILQTIPRPLAGPFKVEDGNTPNDAAWANMLFNGAFGPTTDRPFGSGVERDRLVQADGGLEGQGR